MVDFIHRAPVDEFMARVGIPFKFDPGHVTVVNAATIVLLVVLVSRITTKMKAIPVMAVGIAIGSAGFLILALTRSAWMFVLSIAVFSIGEMTAHPKYYSYVGLVAPQDKKAVYMGYAFLYGVFGSLFGMNLGAVLYENREYPQTYCSNREGSRGRSSSDRRSNNPGQIFLADFCCSWGSLPYKHASL
jgi:MFS family permease